MRQIDNMTPQEIETLALKGMTAPRKRWERPANWHPAPNKAQPQHPPEQGETLVEPRNIENHHFTDTGKMVIEQPSPLPWKLEHWKYADGRVIPTLISQDRDATAQVLDLWCMDTRQNERDANAKLIVRAVNHADKLAEALRYIADWALQMYEPGIRSKAIEALAAYDKAKGGDQ